MTDPLASVFKALADPSRRQLLDLLKGGPATTGKLAEAFSLSRYAVMKHLGILQAANLITVKREGRERWNYLNPMPLQTVYDRWLGPYTAHWAQSLSELERITSIPENTMEASSVVDLNTLDVRLETQLSATPERVFEALTEQIGLWWGAPYLRDKKSATDVLLEARPGGRLLEVWGENEGAVWGEVTRIKAPEVLELTGRMGMTGPVYAVVAFTLTPAKGGTLLTLTHQAVGDVDAETETGYQAGWADLIADRLKALVEDGTPSGVRS